MFQSPLLLIVQGAIPEKAGVDAVHIAAAAVEECDFLLTWNFRHIANVRMRREVERIWRIMATTKRPSVTPKNSSKQKPWEDGVLRQLYAERDKYAAEFGFDLDRIFADLKRCEVKSRMRRSKVSAQTQ